LYPASAQNAGFGPENTHCIHKAEAFEGYVWNLFDGVQFWWPGMAINND
jgi:hypothetical protein